MFVLSIYNFANLMKLGGARVDIKFRKKLIIIWVKDSFEITEIFFIQFLQFSIRH
jgi:hypothetical protein